MLKRVVVVFGAVILLGSSSLAAQAKPAQSKEPVSAGRPLSQWIADLKAAAPQTRNAAAYEIAGMGPQGYPARGVLRSSQCRSSCSVVDEISDSPLCPQSARHPRGNRGKRGDPHYTRATSGRFLVLQQWGHNHRADSEACHGWRRAYRLRHNSL